MPQTFVNPFTPLTPIGAGIQNIATALFSGRTPADDQKMAMNTAHTALYSAQADKLRRDGEREDDLARRRGDPFINETVALQHGIPLSSVDAYRGYVKGDSPMPPALPGGASIGPVADSLFALRTGTSDKTVNAKEIADAARASAVNRAANSVISGGANPLPLAQAMFAVSGKAPYDNMGGTGAFNQLTGEQSLNPLGESKVKTETAHAGLYRDQGTNQRAQAGEHGARTSQINQETRTGVKIGAPVVVQDPETGAPVYSPPQTAATLRQTAGKLFNPNGRTTTTTDANGNVVTTTDSTDPIKPIKATPKDRSEVLGAIDRALGAKLSDPRVESQVMERAMSYFSTPGSEAYGNHDAAARLAAKDIIKDGVSQGFMGMGAGRPNGTVAAPDGPIATPGPTTTERKKVATKGGGGGQQPGNKAAASTVNSATAPTRISGDADFAKLPSKAFFVGPDGVTRQKP